MDYNKELFTLVHEAAYVLALEADNRITRKQYEDWREIWMNTFARVMIAMTAEKEKDELPTTDN